MVAPPEAKSTPWCARSACITEPSGAEGGFAGMAIIGIPTSTMLSTTSTLALINVRTENLQEGCAIRVERSGCPVNILLSLWCKVYPCTAPALMELEYALCVLGINPLFSVLWIDPGGA